MPYKFNPLSGNFDIVNTPLVNPLLFKGAINANTDFPLIADVENGWFYTIGTDVTDDAGANYTNTGQSFIIGDEIAWNGTNWTEIGSTTPDLAQVCGVGQTTGTDITAASYLTEYSVATVGNSTGLFFGEANRYGAIETEITQEIAGRDTGAAKMDFGLMTGGIHATKMTLYPTYLDMVTHQIKEVVDPTSDQDAATKKYADDNDFWDRTGTILSPETSGDAVHIDNAATKTLELLKVDGDNLSTIKDNVMSVGGTDPNCIARWKLNEDAVNTDVEDDVGGFDGTLFGGNTTDKHAVSGNPPNLNGCFHLDGNADYVDCGTQVGTALGDNCTDISVSLWFKADITSANDGIFSIGSLASAHGQLRLFVSTDNLRLRANASEFNQSYAFSDTSSWHHAVVTYDGTDMKLYLDNSVVINEPYTTLLDFDGLKFIIGAYYSTGYTFDGLMDEVRIYDKALSVAEVSTIYNSGNGTENVAIAGVANEINVLQSRDGISAGEFGAVELGFDAVRNTLNGQTIRFNIDSTEVGQIDASGDLLWANSIQIDDDEKVLFGTGSDASIKYNATNLVINPAEVGTGYLQVDGEILATDKIMFTQTDGNEYIDSLNDGYIDIGATTGIRLLAETTFSQFPITPSAAPDADYEVANKKYVDDQITAEDLDFAGDSGTGAVDLDLQTFTLSGTANEIETSASGQTLTVGIVTSPTLDGTNITGVPAASILAGSFGTGSYVIDTLLTTSSLNVDSGTLAVNLPSYEDKVGIGTATPATTLQIKGNGADFSLVQADDKYSVVFGSSGDGEGYIATFDDKVFPPTLADATIKLYGKAGEDNWINNAGNFGLGTTTPTYKLDVAGNAGFDEFIYHNDDPNTYIRLRDDILELHAGSNYAKLQASATATIINPSSQDFNTIIHGTTANLLFADSGTNRVGIGTATPLAQLHTTGGRIKGTTRVTTTYDILITDDRVFANTDSGAFTATLPAGVEGQEFRIINSGTSGLDLTLAPNGAENLIGANSSITISDSESIILNYNATDGWY